MIEIEELGLTIHNVIGGNTKYLEDYMGLYEEFLPQYMRYAPAMRQRAAAPVDENANEVWYQWLLMINGSTAGIIGFLYNKKRNVGLMVDFAINPELRAIQYKHHKTFASLIIELALHQLTHDAVKHGYNNALGLIAEVEHVQLIQKYAEYGYLLLPVEYEEPPYTPDLANLTAEKQKLDKIGYTKLYLGIFQPTDSILDANDPLLIKTVLLALLEDHYQLESSHWLIQKLIQNTTA